MKPKLFIVVAGLILNHCAFGDDAVEIGENNELVIKNSVMVPAPFKDWDWYEGEKQERNGVKISTYVCASPDEKSTFNLLVIHDHLKEDKEKFVKGLVQGAANRAKKDGFQLTEFETKKSKISWTGSIEYRASLSGPDSKLHLKGFIAFGREIYALQYSGPKEAPEFFEKVANGMKYLGNDSNPKKTADTNK